MYAGRTLFILPFSITVYFVVVCSWSSLFKDCQHSYTHFIRHAVLPVFVLCPCNRIQIVRVLDLNSKQI